MKKQLSSNFTLAQEVVTPVLLTAVFGFGAVMALIHDHFGTFLYLLGLITFVQFVFSFASYPLKHVFITEVGLLVSNYRLTITVPFSQVQSVKTIWYYPTLTEIRLREPCQFGMAVLFMPKLTLSLPFVRTESAEALILSKCEEARQNGLPRTGDT